MATLADIRTKVRRLTRSPSTNQITDNQIDDYVDNFVLYDFPEQLRLFAFRRVLSFYTTPYIDFYDTNTTNTSDPLYNFKNAYITVHDPVYIGGKKAYFTQSRNDFYNIYPAIQGKEQIGTGDGATTLFTGTLDNTPILPYNCVFSSYDANYEGIVLKDIPTVDGVTGWPLVLADLVVPDDTTSVGSLNYVTGVYSLTFPAAPEDGAEIYAQYCAHTPGQPSAVLYYDNKFILRPVPDISYKVSIECFIRPTAIAGTDHDPTAEPFLEQHWQYLALGAARKILQDRLDMETVQLIEPEFREQELFVLRRTLVQQSNERVATIYTQQVNPNSGWGWDNYR